MGDIVSLPRHRKGRAGAEAKATADANAAKFGRTKAERAQAEREAALAAARLDAHRRDDAPEA